MARILCKNSSGTINWRDESATSGYYKLKKNSSTSIGWHLDEDGGNYLFKDGTSVGWRNKVFTSPVIEHGRDNWETNYNTYTTYNFSLKSPVTAENRRIVVLWSKYGDGTITIDTSSGSISENPRKNWIINASSPAVGAFELSLLDVAAGSTGVLSISDKGSTGTNGINKLVFMEVSGGSGEYVHATNRIISGSNTVCRAPASGYLTSPNDCVYLGISFIRPTDAYQSFRDFNGGTSNVNLHETGTTEQAVGLIGWSTSALNSLYAETTIAANNRCNLCLMVIQ